MENYLNENRQSYSMRIKKISEVLDNKDLREDLMKKGREQRARGPVMFRRPLATGH